MNNTYTIAHYLTHISQTLAPVYADPLVCQQYAWWLLQAISKKKKIELVTQETIMFNHEQHKLLEKWLHLLVHEHMPIAYILGSVPFNGLDILVEPPILIPRPETEEWCLHILKHLMLLENKKLSILDIATGSGCIALTFAHHLPLAQVIGTDISDKALALAEKNREHNKHLTNVIFIKSDLFNNIPHDMHFDIIVSNPPYIAPHMWDTLDPSVTCWEDYNALIAPDNGLALIKKIITQAPSFIKKNEEMRLKNVPQIVIEIDSNQGTQTKKLMEDAGYNAVLIEQDLEKKDRFAVGRVDYVATAHTRK